MAGRHVKPRTSRVPFTAAAALTALTAVLSVTALTGPSRGAERSSAAPAAVTLPALPGEVPAAPQRPAPAYTHTVLGHTYTAAPYTHTVSAVRLAAARRVWVGHRRNRAMRWALHQAGKPYIWAGTGPTGFDCSGLVMMAYLHASGRALPHSTYSMLSSGMLVAVSHPKYGYMAFYGSGHVELFVRPGVTYGAAHTGTVIGFHHYSGSWAPTMFFRLR
jgi:cell wall-associated NlpC family hydrolase